MMKTTLKFQLRKPRSKSGRSKLALLITRYRVTKTISTSYRLSPAEWDERRQAIRIPENAFPEREKELAKFQRSLKKERQLLHNMLKTQEELYDYSSQDFIDLYCEQQKGQLFCKYVSQRVEALDAANRFSTAHTCRFAGVSFSKFINNKDIRIEKINASLIKSYERYLESTKKSRNTISTYMRSLRAAYNQAICESKFLSVQKMQENPFSGVFTGNARTAERAISKESISLLAKMLNEEKPEEKSEEILEMKPKEKKRRNFDDSLKLSLNVFLFSFVTQGMSFSDVANLKKENIKGNHILYNRKKTGQPISIELEDYIKRIIDRYADDNSEYVFPMLRGIEDERTKWVKTHSALAKYNLNLKELAKLAGIDAHLTSYVARHSWASVASQIGVPIATISHGMGHQSERTTQIYISRLDRADVKYANKKVIDTVEGTG